MTEPSEQPGVERRVLPTRADQPSDFPEAESASFAYPLTCTTRAMLRLAAEIDDPRSPDLALQRRHRKHHGLRRLYEVEDPRQAYWTGAGFRLLELSAAQHGIAIPTVTHQIVDAIADPRHLPGTIVETWRAEVEANDDAYGNLLRRTPDEVRVPVLLLNRAVQSAIQIERMNRTFAASRPPEFES